MTEQEECEILCGLIGWKKADECRHVDQRGFLQPSPTFNDWASTGLILDAFESRGLKVEFWGKQGTWQCLIDTDPLLIRQADTGPLAIRAAALRYMKQI